MMTMMIEIGWSIIPFLFEFIAVSYVVYHCDSCQQMTRKRVDDITTTMIKDDLIPDMSEFSNELMRNSCEEFTAWQVLDLNRKTFVIFACLLLTTVIIVT